MADIQAKLQEEKILKSTRAKRRLRAAIRHVIYNISWMQEDEDDIDLDENVKQTVSRLTRKRKAAKGLTIKEKAIMRKDIKYRTTEEKEYLNKIIGGMKCFRLYPEDVQLELVGVTYFEYYGPGRVLIRQNDEGHALYFLLTGEILITRTEWDEIANEYVEIELCRLGAGNMFGEIALLHNIRRTATCSTTAPCELLVLKREDFDRVLKASLMEIWEEVRDSMIDLNYFGYLDNVAIRECCMLSFIKLYGPNDIVFGDGVTKKESRMMTYFLIEGHCSVVEHMYIQEFSRLGKKSYKLYKIHKASTESVVEREHFGETEMSEKVKAIIEETFAEKTEFGIEEQKAPTEEEKIPTEEKAPAEEKASAEEKTSTEEKAPADEKTSTEEKSSDKEKIPLQEKIPIEEKAPAEEEKVKEDKPIKTAEPSLNNNRHYKKQEPGPSTQKEKTKPTLPHNVNIHFIQLCVLGPKAMFMGTSKILENRRIIALGPVKFLLIPTYWLYRHNRANMWNRIEKFLQLRIPTSKQVFEKYVTNKKWNQYKKTLLNDILSKKQFYNTTTIHDVPYSIRVVSDYE